MPDPGKTTISMPLSSSEPMKADVPDTIRKRYIVSGQVQDVGYRTLVKQKARNKGLVGVTRNLADGTVEIVCEGDSGAIDVFLKDIDQKTDNPSPLDIDVASIVESPPAPTGVYKSFEVDYGKKLSVAERSTKDREEITVLGTAMANQKLTGLGQKMDVLGDKMDGVGKDVREVGQKVGGVGKAVEGVGQKVDNVGKAVHDMHSDMNKRFDHMADRYDMIAASLKDAIVHMDRNAAKTDKAIERSRKESAAEAIRTRKEIAKSHRDTSRELALSRKETIIEVRKSQRETAAELSKSRKEVAASNRELAGAVKFMIRKLSGRPATARRETRKKRK